MNESLNALRRNLLNLLSGSKPKNLTENIERTEQLKQNLLVLKSKIEHLALKSRTIVPFKSRTLKLRPPNNICKCLIQFKRNQIHILKDEECYIEDNSDLIKWKLILRNGQSILAPSVCFALKPNTIEFNDMLAQLTKRCDDLLKEAQNCQRQFKKDKMFAQMNIIKTCELDEVTDNLRVKKEYVQTS